MSRRSLCHLTSAVLLVAGLVVSTHAEKKPATNSKILITKDQSRWKYWDKRKEPAGDWNAPDYDDADWPEGQAPLGYGDAFIATPLSHGEDPRQKHLVAYFRQTVEAVEPTDFAHLAARILSDDAAAVYLNGKEVFRWNLPKGELKQTTAAVIAMGQPDEARYWGFLIDSKLLRKGENTIAVRVHQANAASSDLSLDFELRGVNKEEAKRFEAQIQSERGKKGEYVDTPDGAFAAEFRRVPRAAVAAPVAAAVAVASRKSFIHLSDGETQYHNADGSLVTRRMDAIQQAKSHVPEAKFIRVLEGDTAVKIAAQYDVPFETLRLLNRLGADKSYRDQELVCIGWKHRVSRSDTPAALAEIYNTNVSTLMRMNQLEPGDQFTQGTTIQVPGEFTYVTGSNRSAYLKLARYRNPNPAQVVPFDPRSQRVDIKQVKEGQDLKAFAQANQITVEFLSVMNGLTEEAKLEPGQRLLVKYSVETTKDATFEDLVNHFQVQSDLMLAANGLKQPREMKPGQRMEVPMGERMGLGGAQRAAPRSNAEFHEVILGKNE